MCCACGRHHLSFAPPCGRHPPDDPPTLLLLTGATGFVGRATVRALVERGWRVRCLTRDLVAARRALEAETRDGPVPSPWGGVEHAVESVERHL